MRFPHNHSTRNITIDCLRAIAALSVLVHHVIADASTLGSLGTFGVYVFFLISGYCIVLSLPKLGMRPIRNFLIRRAFRLYPVYWLAVFFAAYLSSSEIPWKVLLANLTMIQAALLVPDINGVFWTLFVEIIFYSIVVLFIFLRIERRPSTYFIGAIVFTIGALAAAIVGRSTGLAIPFAHSLFLSLFLIGGWAALIHRRLDSIDPWLVLLGGGAYLVAVYSIAELVYGLGGRSDAMPPAAFFGNYFAAIVLFTLTLRYSLFDWPWLRYLGEISFGIYLFHRPIRDVLDTEVNNTYLRLALVFFGAVLISYVVNKLIEDRLIRVGRRLASP